MGNTASAGIVTSVGVKVSEPTKDSSHVIRSRQCPNELQWKPFPDEPHVDSLTAVLARSFKVYADCPCAGLRTKEADGTRGPYVFETYGQVGAAVTKLATAMDTALGLTAPSAVGIFSINRVEWMKTEMAVFASGNFIVALYDTLGANAVSYILNDACVSVVFASADKIPLLFSSTEGNKFLKTIVSFDPVTPELEAKAQAAGVKLLLFTELIAQVADDAIVPFHESMPKDLAYIMYTSGTTGNPKGVRLTHQNFLATSTGLTMGGFGLGASDVYLSYLPLAHSFEACCEFMGLTVGASVGFFQGNIKLLTDDILTLRPTLFCGVPRVYTRIYDKMQQTIAQSGFIKKTLFETAFRNQLENLRHGSRNPFWDTLVFDKIKGRLGGRVRIMASGAAPLAAHVTDFLKVCFCCEVLQGYGMTENTGAATAQPLGYTQAGTVGEPIGCCEIKLQDVPEMNYTHMDQPNPRGEVCIRGYNVFDGYHNLPDATKEALDADGWLHTGDIGQFLPDGALQIIDRKKNIFKLAQGEYVAAEELENVFKKCKYISQIWVYGNSFQVTLLAVVCLDPETIMPWCHQNGIEGEYKTAVMHAKVNELIVKEIDAIAKADKVAGFKVPKDVIVEAEINDLALGFTVENDCMTPTFKLRRPQLLAHYKTVIDATYVQRNALMAGKD